MMMEARQLIIVLLYWLTVLYCLQLPVVLGCAVPLIIPIACVGVVLNASVFHIIVEHFEILIDNARASYNYLWLSMILGIALPSLWFWENSFAARWLVLIGMPASVGLGAVLARVSCGVASQGRARELVKKSLLEPLFGTNDRETEEDWGQMHAASAGVCLQLSAMPVATADEEQQGVARG